MSLFVPLFIFGVINVYFENVTFGEFFKIYLNIFVGVLFFYYVFEYYERDLKKFFEIYMQWSYVAALIGIMQLLSFWVGFKYGYDFRWLGFNKWGVTEGGFGIRVNSIFCEPSYVGSTLGPAFFVSVYNIIFNKNFFSTKIMNIAIVVCYLLSTSTVAYMGIFVCLFLLLLNYGLVRYIAFVIPFALMLFMYIYSNVPEFKVRMDGLKSLYIDDILATKGLDKTKGGAVYQQEATKYLLTKIHGSSFIQYNNYFITKNNFFENPLFGSGLGSHEVAFEKYDLSPKLGNLYDGNQADANSMLLRTISETGLFGLIFLILFIRNNYLKRGNLPPPYDYHWLISNATLVIIILQLIRQGNYTFGGFMAFMWLYYYAKQDYALLEEQIENNELDIKFIDDEVEENQNHKNIIKPLS